MHRSGETVVRLSTDDYVQVGFFGAAYSIYLTGAQALWQLAVSFAPFLISRVHQGDTASAALWLERLLKGMAIVASMSALAWVFIGADIVPLVLGHSYRPVAWNLAPLTVALIAFALCSVGRLISWSSIGRAIPPWPPAASGHDVPAHQATGADDPGQRRGPVGLTAVPTERPSRGSLTMR